MEYVSHERERDGHFIFFIYGDSTVNIDLLWNYI